MSTSLIFKTTKQSSEQPHNTSYMKEREAEGVGGRKDRGGTESGTFIHVQRIQEFKFLSFQYNPKTFLFLCPSVNQPEIEGECATYWF